MLDLAAKRGMHVIFERRGTHAKDATGAFATLIKKQGWPVGNLLIDGIGSS